MIYVADIQGLIYMRSYCIIFSTMFNSRINDNCNLLSLTNLIHSPPTMPTRFDPCDYINRMEWCSLDDEKCTSNSTCRQQPMYIYIHMHMSMEQSNSYKKLANHTNLHTLLKSPVKTELIHNAIHLPSFTTVHTHFSFFDGLPIKDKLFGTLKTQNILVKSCRNRKDCP